tara:strand:+ start:660 stop:848 length:189 start_codon:yes stop_codon:yes gene_type:complete
MTFIPDNILEGLDPEGLEELIVDIRRQWASLNPSHELINGIYTLVDEPKKASAKILKLNEKN